MPKIALPVRTLVVLGALSAFGPLSMDLYLPALPDLAADLGTSASTAQLTMSACMVGLAAGQLFVGPLSDRVGRRMPLLVGVAVYAVTSLLCALAPSVGVLVGLRVVQGIAGGAGIVIARAIVRDMCEGDAIARVFSVLMLINGAAPVLAPVLGAQLLRISPWEGAFYALAVVGSVLLATAAVALPESLPVARQNPGGLRATGSAMVVALRDRQFLAGTAVLALGSAMLFCYISMSSFIFQGIFDLGPQPFALVFAGNSVGLIAMGPIGSASITRWGVSRTLTVGLLVATAGSCCLVGLALIGAGLAPTIAVLFLTVSAIGLIMPGATALGLADQGDRAGTASGLMGMAQFALGAIVGPLASLGGVTSLAMAISMALSAGLALLINLAVLKPRSRPHNAPAPSLPPASPI